MKNVTILVLICVLPVVALCQQNVNDKIAQKVEQLKAQLTTPPIQWSDAFIKSTFESYFNLYLDLLWGPDFHAKAAEYLPKARPTITVELAGELRTPYMRKGEMVIPVEYLRYLVAIGVLVGHDAYVQDHFIATKYPLLSLPYQESAIIPLLQPLSLGVDLQPFMAMQVYLVCPQADEYCAAVENEGTTAVILFAILHELSHERLQHNMSEEGVNLEHEIAADKNAYKVLSIAASELRSGPSDFVSEMQFATLVAPFVFFEVETSRLQALSGMSKAREAALASTLSPEMKGKLESFIQPDVSSDNVSHLTIDWSEQPDVLLIDGVATPVKEVEGKVWTVTGERHTLIALKPGKIATALVHPSGISTPTHAHLFFRAFPPSDPDAIKMAHDTKNWTEVLARTTDDNLQPRNPTLSLYHFEALHRLGLNSHIQVQDWNAIPQSDWRKVKVWQSEAEPLSSWE